jgi:hypothetical protein
MKTNVEHWKCPICGTNYFPDSGWMFIEFRCQKCHHLCTLQSRKWWQIVVTNTEHFTDSEKEKD